MTIFTFDISFNKLSQKKPIKKDLFFRDMMKHVHWQRRGVLPQQGIYYYFGRSMITAIFSSIVFTILILLKL